MIYSQELLNRLHRLSYANRPLVERSTVCGCFHCGAIYSPDIIDPETDYCIDSPYDTATCPYCWIDSVICDAMDVEITPELLEEMRVEFFEKDAEEEEEVRVSERNNEEPDDRLKRVSFPSYDHDFCVVFFKDGSTASLGRAALAAAIRTEPANCISVASAYPSGKSVIMQLELPDETSREVAWHYYSDEVRVIR